MCGERLPPSPALLGSLMPPSPAPRWVFPGSIQAGGESGAGQTLGLWWLSSWESPACSDFTLLSNFLAFARELGACSEPAPCVCVGGVGGERLWLSPGGLKSQLEEGGKRKIKAARFSGPHIFSQACGSSSEGCVRTHGGAACVLHTRTWRCCGGVRDREGFVPWGTPQTPAPTANLRCPLQPLRVLGARGCSAGGDEPWCRVSRANVHNLSGVLHPIYAFPYCAAGPKHPKGPRAILPASRPAPCRIHPSPPSLSPGATASAPSPALRKATPHRGRAMFIRNETQRAGLLWQVCCKYWLERGGRLASGDYTLLPRETLPHPVQALPQPSKRCR